MSGNTLRLAAVFFVCVLCGLAITLSPFVEQRNIKTANTAVEMGRNVSSERNVFDTHNRRKNSDDYSKDRIKNFSFREPSGAITLIRTQELTGLSVTEQPILKIDAAHHAARIQSFDVSRSHQMAATASWDKTVRLWSLNGTSKPPRLTRTIRFPEGNGEIGRAYTVAFSEDEQTLLVGGHFAGIDGSVSAIYVVDVNTGKVRATLPTHAPTIKIKYSKDYRFIFSGHNDGTVLRWDAAKLNIINEFKSPTQPIWDIEPGERAVYFASVGKLFKSDLDLTNVDSIDTRGGHQPFDISLSPSSQKLLVGYQDTNNVTVFNARTLSEKFRPDTSDIDNGSLAMVAWSLDGKHMFAGGRADLPLTG